MDIVLKRPGIFLVWTEQGKTLKSLILECKIGKGCIYFRSEIIPRPRLRPVQGLVIVSISSRGKLRLRPMSGGALLPVLPLPGSGKAPRISGSEC